MSFSEMASNLWQFWLLGIAILFLTYNSEYKDLLKIDFKAIFRFLRFMSIITILRYISLKFFTSPEGLEGAKRLASYLPLGGVLGVFWEDSVHTLPLVLLERMYGEKKWFKYIKYPLLLIVMLSFGSGHLYQGILTSLFLSFYIPFAIKWSKRYGFGTVMLCHVFL